MGMFGAKRPLGASEWEWQLAGLKWLLAEFGGLEELRKGELILPTAEFFPASDAKNHVFATEMFERVKLHARMEDWPTRLEPRAAIDKPQLVQPGLMVASTGQEVLGDFKIEELENGGHTAVIRYSSDQAETPSDLVATMAHELAHYLIATSKTCPPGGWDVSEMATDLAAVFLGFGVFLGNSARNFRGFTEFDQMGWQNIPQGYLSERALMTALAVTETLADRDPLVAAPYLKNYLVKDLKLAAKYAMRLDLSAEIEAIDLAEYGVQPHKEE